MFRQATNFNQPLNDWNVASVRGMSYMFRSAPNFNQPLNDWNVESVNGISFIMFRAATNFNQPLDDWDVTSVNAMFYMFYEANSFNQCLSSWAFKAPTDVYLRDMFYGTSCPNTEPVASVGPWCQGEDLLCYALH